MTEPDQEKALVSEGAASRRRKALALKALVCWLGLLFIWLVWLSFSGVKKEAPADPLRVVERLVVVAKYSSEVPEHIRIRMLETALELESDPVIKRVIKGETISAEQSEGLSRVYNLMLAHTANPTTETERSLSALAREGTLRFALSGAGLLSILLTALLSLVWPKPARTGEVESLMISPWEVLGLFFLWHVGGVFLAGVFQMIVPTISLPIVWVFAGQSLVYAWMVCLLYLVRGRFRTLPFRRFDMAWVGKGYFLAVGCLLTINLLESVIMGEPGQSENPVLRLFDGAPLWQYLSLGLLVVVIGPFFEEVIFRGWLYAGLAGHLGHVRAAVISSALFAVIHSDLPALLPLFVLGLIFAWVYRKTGSLWGCLLLHSMWNATTFSLLISVMP